MSEEIFCAKAPAKFQSNWKNLYQFLTPSEISGHFDLKRVTG